MAELTKKLGQRIKELRRKNGLTQFELSEIISMDTTNLCKLENGGQLPKVENIEKIAHALNVEVKDLFDFGHIKNREEIEDELFNIIKNLSQKDLEKFYKIANAIIE